MYKLLSVVSISVVCAASLVTSPVLAQAARDIRDKVTVLAMNNPDQQFDLAAKLQWNASHKRWDRVLVTYNGTPTPPLNHSVWSYLSNMRIPTQPGSKPGENRLYKVFYADAYCTGVTPLANGRPWLINFENDTVGAYTKPEFFRDWNCPNWNESGMRQTQIVSGSEARRGNDKVLKINLAQGQVGCAERGGDACVQWKPHIGARLKTVTYSYWIKFPADFDFVAGGRLPSIGSVVPLPEGTRANGKNGWSVGAVWQANGNLGQYVSHMNQARAAGDFWAWTTAPIRKGQWHQVKTTVRLNAPNQSNGSVMTWLDGQPVLNKGGLRFRNTDQLMIERLSFTVFHTGRAPTQARQVYIDDFQLQP